MSDTSLSLRLYGPAAQIDAAAWDACANPERLEQPHPFTRHAFFLACENSGSAVVRTGWQPCHLAAERAGVIEGILPLYLKHHSRGEYVFDQGWAEALERAGGQYYPKLQSSVPFTPVTGRRLLIAAQADAVEIKTALLQGAKQAATELQASSVHITFPTQPEWQSAGAQGYLQRMDQQFHWENRGYTCFDDFLDEMASAKRKSLRKERQRVRDAGIEFDWLTGAQISEAHWDRFFAFYTDTSSRKWGKPYLTREFFSLLGQAMAEQVVLILARRGDDYIAGALNLMGGGTLYGRNWGASEYVPFLHFETCYYQAIDFAIARGLQRVEAGAQGEHKLLRGYMPVQTYSAHYIVHPGLRQAVDDYLKRETQAAAAQIDALAEFAPFRKIP